MKYVKLLGLVALLGLGTAAGAMFGGWTGGKIGELITTEFMKF